MLKLLIKLIQFIGEFLLGNKLAHKYLGAKRSFYNELYKHPIWDDDKK